MHIYQVLQSVYGILMTLEVRDAVDPMSTLKFWTDPGSSNSEVAQYVRIPFLIPFALRLSTYSCSRSPVSPPETVFGICGRFLNPPEERSETGFFYFRNGYWNTVAASFLYSII